ncbi:MAG: GGDEF domain-containing protein [Janthinobacterium lividum]
MTTRATPGRYDSGVLRSRIAREPIVVNGREISITVSIGVTPVQSDADGIVRSLRDADLLMYQAKHAGRDIVFSS